MARCEALRARQNGLGAPEGVSGEVETAKTAGRKPTRRERQEKSWAKIDAERKEREQAGSEWLKKYLANVTQRDGFGMTCGKCGHVGNFDDFITDSFGGERGRADYQCPACRYAFRRQLHKSGGFIELVPIQPTL